MFIGPLICAPFIILAGYGMGQQYDKIPILIKIAMRFSFVRYAVTGVVAVMLKDRRNLECPDEEDLCPFVNSNYFLSTIGMDKTDLWIDIPALIINMIVFRAVALFLLRQRLCHGKTLQAIKLIGSIVKNHFNLTR